MAHSRKTLLFLALVLVVAVFMVFALCACGSSGTLEGEAAEAAVNQLQQQEQNIIAEIEQTEEALNPQDAPSFAVEPECCDMLTDAFVADGWWYYYTDTLDSPAPAYEWQKGADAYTIGEVTVFFTNTSSEPAVPAELCTMELRWNGNATQSAVLQINPGQTDQNGYEIFSTVFKPLEPGETTRLCFRFDVSRELYDYIMNGAAADAAVNCAGTEYVFPFVLIA